MMATATNTTGPSGNPDGSKKNEATAASSPPVQARSSRPRALRIDVGLAENHARKTGAAGGFGRIDEKSRHKTIPTSRPPKTDRDKRSVAESCGGGDNIPWEAAVAESQADVGLGESHARAERPGVLAAGGGIGELRDLLEDRRRSGIVTRSTGRRSTARGSNTAKNVVVDGEDKNMAPGDGVPQTLGSAGGGDGNGDEANDAACSRSAVKRILSNVERHFWSDQEGVETAGGDEAAVSTGVGISLESREGQGRIKRLRRGGVAEAGREKVNGNNSQTHLQLSRSPNRHHHQLEQRSGVNDEQAQCLQDQHQHNLLVGPNTMVEVAALMKQALATAAMASAVSAAAESTPITTTEVKTPLAPPPSPLPASATAATAAPPKKITTTIAPPPPQEQKSNSTFREANATYMELRSFANDIDARCAAAIKTLHAASQAVASPGEELNRSYDAYWHAYRSLQAAERSVRDAEEQEDAAVDELRRAAKAVEPLEGEVARAAKALREFDAGRGDGSSGRFPPKNDTAKKKQRSDGDNDNDDDDDDCNGSDREGPPPPALSDEADSLQNGTHKHDTSGRTRESLALALETAGSNADRVLAEQYRAQQAAVAAMTLVGARTAGEWSLAAEACDAAKKRFQTAGLEAIPKITFFSEEARLFRNLNKLRSDTRMRLSAASQAREAARVATAEAVAVAVTRRMSAPVATAVAVKAAAEAAARAAALGGGDGEHVSLSQPAVKQEAKEGGKEADGKEEEAEGGKEGEEEGTLQKVLSATPWVSGEEPGGKKKGGAKGTRAFATTLNKEGAATKKAKK